MTAQQGSNPRGRIGVHAQARGGQTAPDCIVEAWHDHATELRGYLIRRLGDADRAEDLLQDTFMKAIGQGNAFCRLDHPRGWLFQVARNVAIDRVRMARPHAAWPAGDLAAPPADERAPVDELDACVPRQLAGMPADDRGIIEQCDLRGVLQREFALAHGLSLSATKARLLRARRRLHQTLMRECQVAFDDAGHVCCHLPRR